MRSYRSCGGLRRQAALLRCVERVDNWSFGGIAGGRRLSYAICSYADALKTLLHLCRRRIKTNNDVEFSTIVMPGQEALMRHGLLRHWSGAYIVAFLRST